VHNRGVEIDKKKSRAIKEAPPSRSKKELRRLIGQINFPGGSSPILHGKSSLSPHFSRQQRMKSFFRTRAMAQSCNESKMTSLRHQLEYLLGPENRYSYTYHIISLKRVVGSILIAEERRW